MLQLRRERAAASPPSRPASALERYDYEEEQETQESLSSESWGNARGVLAAASARDGYDTYNMGS